MHYFIKLRKNMEVEKVILEDFTCETLAATINCDYIEQIPVRSLMTTPPLCFIIDEERALRKDREVNSLASSLYGQTIYGDVLIAHEIQNNGMIETFPLSENMAKNLYDMFTEVVADVRNNKD